jgi:hypothetical protein
VTALRRRKTGEDWQRVSQKANAKSPVWAERGSSGNCPYRHSRRHPWLNEEDGRELSTWCREKRCTLRAGTGSVERGGKKGTLQSTVSRLNCKHYTLC